MGIFQTLFELMYFSLLFMNGAAVFFLCLLMVLIVTLEIANFFLKAFGMR